MRKHEWKLQARLLKAAGYFVLTTQIVACYVWRQVPVQRPVAADQRVMVRVLRNDSSWVVLQDAQVKGNQLIGDEVYPGNLYDRKIPLDGILTAEAYRMDGKRTVG